MPLAPQCLTWQSDYHVGSYALAMFKFTLSIIRFKPCVFNDSSAEAVMGSTEPHSLLFSVSPLQWFSRCGPWTNSISIGWKLLWITRDGVQPPVYVQVPQEILRHTKVPEPLFYMKPAFLFDSGSYCKCFHLFIISFLSLISHSSHIKRFPRFCHSTSLSLVESIPFLAIPCHYYSHSGSH